MKTKQKVIIGSSILGVILVFALVFFFAMQGNQQSVFNNQCALDACSAGYTSESSTCSGQTCTRICSKIVPAHCSDSFSAYPDYTGTFNFGVGDQNILKEIAGVAFEEDPGYCYKYGQGAVMTVTNRDPGGIFHLGSDSHRLYMQLNDNSGTLESNSVCFTENQKSIALAQTGVARGVRGRIVTPGVQFNSYGGSTCGTASYGSLGKIDVTLRVFWSYWLDQTKEYEPQKTCTFECSTNAQCSGGSTGQNYCSSGNVVRDVVSPTCTNYVCGTTQNTENVETCQFGCANGACKPKTCNAGFIGSKSCLNNNIVQNYQNADCTSQVKTITSCRTDQTCNNAICENKDTPGTDTGTGKTDTSDTGSNTGTVDTSGYIIENSKCVYTRSGAVYSDNELCLESLGTDATGTGNETTANNMILIIGISLVSLFIIALIIFAIYMKVKK
jgi:hypothetical protein